MCRGFHPPMSDFGAPRVPGTLDKATRCQQAEPGEDEKSRAWLWRGRTLAFEIDLVSSQHVAVCVEIVDREGFLNAPGNGASAGAFQYTVADVVDGEALFLKERNSKNRVAVIRIRSRPAEINVYADV